MRSFAPRLRLMLIGLSAVAACAAPPAPATPPPAEPHTAFAADRGQGPERS